MMLHDIIPEQFIFNLKNEHNMLHTTTALHSVHPHTRHQREYHPYHDHQAQVPLPQQTLSEALPLQRLDPIKFYSTFAQQNPTHHHQFLLQQQQLLAENSTALQQQQLILRNAVESPTVSATTEVLDLSRRCDSVETTRKTPSPSPTRRHYDSDSNFSVDSPRSGDHHRHKHHHSSLTQAQALAAAVTHEQQHQQQKVPSNLLYSAQLPPPLSSLYSGLGYTGNVKLENNDSPTETPPTAASIPPSNATPTQDTIMSTQLAVAAAAAAAANASGVTLLHKFSGNTTIPVIPAMPRISTSPSSKTHRSDIVVPVSPVSCYDSSSKSPSAPTTPSNSNAAAATAVHKSTRPFKAYPRDPLVIAANFAAGDMLLDNGRIERYTEYRKRMLEQIRNSNGGSRTVTNPKMRRTNARRDSNTSSNGTSALHESDEQQQHSISGTLDPLDSSDCDSNVGHAEQVTTTNNDGNNNNRSGSTATTTTSTNGQVKDAAYYERRRKNNAAAKKSRDRRRIKEDEIAIRAAYLERQNIELLCQIDALKAQLATYTSKVVSA